MLDFLPQIMANNTLGEWSDGDDDWVFEIDESLWNNSCKDDGNEVLNQITTNTLGENCDVSMWAKMSKYKRDDQKQEWYDDNLLFIYCRHFLHGHAIKDQCKRRNIKQNYYPRCLEGDNNSQLVVVNKIAIYDKGLKVQQLVDWAITRYNNEEMVITEDGVNTCNVWVEFQNVVKPTVGKPPFNYNLHSWTKSD